MTLAFDFRYLKLSALQTSYYYAEAEEERKEKRRLRETIHKMKTRLIKTVKTSLRQSPKITTVSPKTNTDNDLQRGDRKLLMKSKIVSKKDSPLGGSEIMEEDKKVSPLKVSNNKSNPIQLKQKTQKITN